MSREATGRLPLRYPSLMSDVEVGSEHVTLQNPDVSIRLSCEVRIVDSQGAETARWAPPDIGGEMTPDPMTWMPRGIVDSRIFADGRLELVSADGRVLVALPDNSGIETWRVDGWEPSTWGVRCEPTDPAVFVDVLGDIDLPLPGDRLIQVFREDDA